MLAALAVAVALISGAANGPAQYQPKPGDIVFHTSRSAQSLAVQRATKSPYSHMGVVLVRRGRPFVYEAVQPVTLTPLSKWIARGEGRHFVAKRLRNADALLTPANLRKLEAEGMKLKDKDYDLYFEWTDDRIYCSELVWKMYKRALNVEIGRTQRLREFDLTDPAVQEKIRERWQSAPPADEVVISPAAMFNSDVLLTVFER